MLKSLRWSNAQKPKSKSTILQEAITTYHFDQGQWEVVANIIKTQPELLKNENVMYRIVLMAAKINFVKILQSLEPQIVQIILDYKDVMDPSKCNVQSVAKRYGRTDTLDWISDFEKTTIVGEDEDIDFEMVD